MQIRSLVLAAALAGLAAAEDSNDKYKAIGMPMFFLITVGIAAAITWRVIIHAHQRVAHDMGQKIIFMASLVSAVLSIFLYFTAAWAYGLVATCICYFVALAMARPSLQRPLLIVLGLWFACVCGIPATIFGSGIISATSTTACKTFYLTYSDKMCAHGWLAFAEIVSTVIIAITLISFLSVLSWIAKNEDEYDAALAVGTIPALGARLLRRNGPSSSTTGAGDYGGVAVPINSCSDVETPYQTVM